MPIRANALVVMAKAPIPGSVKTRLMPFLSAAQAAALARALLLDQLEHLRSFHNADPYLAFTPVKARRLIRRLAPAQFDIFPQSGAGLGARMRHVFAALFAEKYRRVVLIGGDLPPLPFSYFSRAFAYLHRAQPSAVLGPSLDGGYYLVGLNREQPALFDQTTWSHHQVLAQALTKLDSIGVRRIQLPLCFDIDTVDDLERVLLLPAPQQRLMKNTRRLLHRLPILKHGHASQKQRAKAS